MEQLYKKILIATDGSENNNAAISEALRIARASESVVYALYVIDTGVLNYTGVLNSTTIGDESGYILGSLKAEGENALARVGAMAGDVRVEPRLLYGKPVTEIIDFAVREDVELIVVGARGKSALEAILLGSVADRVIRTAHCPVLVVKS